MAGATWNCCRPGGNSVYTIQLCTSLCTSRLQCHFIQSDIGKMHVFLAVICHLHFWQNDRDLLRATAVTHGWNGYRNKSRHRKLTLEKFILQPLLRGLEPGTFRTRVRRSNHWAILLPTTRQFIGNLTCKIKYFWRRGSLYVARSCVPSPGDGNSGSKIWTSCFFACLWFDSPCSPWYCPENVRFIKNNCYLK